MSSDALATKELAPPKWRLNLVLFALTLGAVFVTGLQNYSGSKDESIFAPSHHTVIAALQFVGTVMTILVAHEFGHYIMARIHKVDASLPFFIPMPLFSPFGTMGAVIRMRGTIPTRRALLDIGASGPIAGMCIAIPLYIWGVAHSHLVPADGEGMAELGESLLVRFLDHFAAPAQPEGMTILYSPVAFGAWGGMFVTMINMLPVGQLDGGHVAYSLFGPRQDKIALTVHRAMLVFFGVIIAGHEMRDISSGRGITIALLSSHTANALFWFVWFNVLAVLGSLAQPPADEEDENAPKPLGIRTRIFTVVSLVLIAGLGREHPSWAFLAAFYGGLAFLIAMDVRGGVLKRHNLLDHPPTGKEPLGLGRKAIAIGTLIMFALLFMPEPFSF